MMFMQNQKHPADNFMMTTWAKLSDTSIFNQVPFGVYAITKPTDHLPPNHVMPFMYENTVYFGKSGNSYDDFLYDRKSVNPNTGKENFHRYSIIERRLKTHRHNILNNNSTIERETSYQVFYENFGYGEDVVEKVNVCVIVPETKIPNYMVSAWLLFVESYFVYQYQLNFGSNTLMNINHGETKKVEDSYSYKRKRDMENSNLMSFF